MLCIPPHHRRLPKTSVPGPEQRYPVVRMISTSTHRRGNLDKRLQSVPFRSVLSLDIEYRNSMPNLKISNRNTIQTGGMALIKKTEESHLRHQRQGVRTWRFFQTFSHIYPGGNGINSFLDSPLIAVTTYQNRGFDIPPGVPPAMPTSAVSFVGDIVLANVHFKLGNRFQYPPVCADHMKSGVVASGPNAAAGRHES